MKRLKLFLIYFASFTCLSFTQQVTKNLKSQDTIQSHSDTISKKSRITNVVLSAPSEAYQRQSAINDLKPMVGKAIQYCIFFYGGREDIQTGTTYLYFGASYPNQYLTVFIDKKDKPKFNYSLINEFIDKEVCITGLLSNNHGSLEVGVNNPKQLEIVFTSPYPIK